MKRFLENNEKPVTKAKKFKKDTVKAKRKRKNKALEKNEDNLDYEEKLAEGRSIKNETQKSTQNLDEPDPLECLTKNDGNDTSTIPSKKRKLQKKEIYKLGEKDEEGTNYRTEELIENESKNKKNKSKIVGELNEDKDLEDSCNLIEENGESQSEGPKKKQPSKRQLKKEKFELRLAAEREVSKQEAAQKALNYVLLWKEAKDQWKFEKLKQIWLINNFMDEKYVPEKNFSIVLEYFEGCKGQAKKQLLEKAELIIKKAEESYEENEEIIETTEYKRAKQLIQTLPNET